jgi:cytochrome P450
MLDFRRDMLGAFLDGHRRYGDIVRFRLGPTLAHGLFHPDLAERVLIHDLDTFGKLSQQHGRKEGVVLMLGNGLVSSYGELWSRQRRMIQPMFHRRQIKIMTAVMAAAGAQTLGIWHNNFHPGEVIDVSREMMALTLNVICKTLFSTELSHDIDAIGRAVDTAIHYVSKRMRNPFSVPAHWPTPSNRRFRQAMDLLDGIVYHIIDRRRTSGERHDDFLDLLLRARDEDSGAPMDPEQLRDEVMTMFAAGHETTANALTWCWHALAQRPDIRERLRAELKRVLGGRTPTFDDLSRLRYTRAVLQETLRLYAPVPVLPRVVLKNTDLRGYPLPAGSKVFVSIYNIHRHPEFWPDPELFDPQRFLDGDGADSGGRHRCAYIPFGTGPRVCIGNHFALTESQLLLAQMAQHFELRPVAEQPVIPELAVTYRPRGGLKLALFPVDHDAEATSPRLDSVAGG